MESGSTFAGYTAHRRALEPSHPLFEAGNWRRDLLARENAPRVRILPRTTSLLATVDTNVCFVSLYDVHLAIQHIRNAADESATGENADERLGV